MRIEAFDSISKHEWNAVAQTSQDAWLMHRAEWVEIETTFFVGKNLSFGLWRDGLLLGIQPLYLSGPEQGTTRGELLVHCGVHRHTGLALTPGLDRHTIGEARSDAMRRTLELARGLGASRIQLSAQNLAPRARSADRDLVPFWVMEHGFQLGLGFGPHGLLPAPGFAVLAADQIVDLTLDEPALFGALDDACRRAVRKAERAAMRFETAAGPGTMDRYWPLAERSATRTGEVLPPRAYYEAILAAFGAEGAVRFCFASDRRRDVAALILLDDRDAVSFLAGVSEPDALETRPNDFIHWHAIRHAKSLGRAVYRFGPVFPECPADWPITRVSAFKGKFGARPVPMIQGSLFLDPDLATAAARSMAEIAPAVARPRRSPAKPAPTLAAEIVAHHLRLFGVPAVTDPDHSGVLVADAGGGGWIAARAAAASGRPAVVLRPDRAAEFMDEVVFPPAEATPPIEPRAVAAGDALWARPRAFHPARPMSAAKGEAVVVDDLGQSLWHWLPSGRAGVMLIGTDLARDLTLLRQGDPDAAARRPTQAQWGIAGERPNYLFEDRLDADRPRDRPADWWMWILRDALIRHAGIAAADVLPFGAPGAVIVTGDDDQAPLDAYQGQASRLGTLPVTYFLHPLTRHDAASMAALGQNRAVEWELHPDALDTPREYAARLAEQATWFQGLTGRRARLVRNHGYLNDGYWGHASAWQQQGIIGSSNLPGVDGRIINGSLLPARLALNGRLTPHWSLLTAFGDGVFFIFDWDAATAVQAVTTAAQEIIASGVPGLLVLNLHPANHERAAAMHEAVHRLVEDLGFAAMTLGAALDWFAARDAGETAAPGAGMVAPGTPTRSRTRPPTHSLARPGVGVPLARQALRALARLGRVGSR